MSNLSPEQARAHWSKTKCLMYASLGLWFILSFVIHAFVNTLNEIVIFGFPLGFYMAAQGSLLLFVALIFWYAKTQNAIDREFGVSED